MGDACNRILPLVGQLPVSDRTQADAHTTGGAIRASTVAERRSVNTGD